MFCTQCGKPLVLGAKFCGNCGSETATGESPPTVALSDLPEIPDVGKTVHIIRKAEIFPCKDNLVAEKVTWIKLPVDLIFTDSHLVIVSAVPQTTLKEFADKVADRLPMGLGLMGGIFGAAIGGVASVVLSGAGAVSEAIYGKGNKLDQQLLRKLFAAGLVIYAEKATLRFEYSKIKLGFLSSMELVFVSGKFAWLNEALDVEINTTDESVNDSAGVRRAFQEGKCNLVDFLKG